MANYSYIGYDPSVITVSFFGGGVTLSNTYDPNADRVLFSVVDGAGGTLVNGAPDNGTDFNGDRFNNEVGDDLTQTGDVTSLDGSVTFLSGNIYLEESYQLFKPGGGTIDVFRVEVDGTLAGYITSEPLVPGTNYPFSISNVTPGNAPDTTDPDAIVDVPCFVKGTLIGTPDGSRPVESLMAGDLVDTADGQARKIRWIGSRTLDLSAQRHLTPIRIAQGALAPNSPSSDLMVSPNHRMLVTKPVNEIHFGDKAVLVAAKHLLGLPGVSVAADVSQVTYFHFIFDRHEIVHSNGAFSESLYPGDIAARGFSEESWNEIVEIFPEIADGVCRNYGPTAARVLKKHEASIMVG